MNQAATESVRKVKRCHGLVPWSFTFAAVTKPQNLTEMPRRKAVASRIGLSRTVEFFAHFVCLSLLGFVCCILPKIK